MLHRARLRRVGKFGQTETTEVKSSLTRIKERASTAPARLNSIPACRISVAKGGVYISSRLGSIRRFFEDPNDMKPTTVTVPIVNAAENYKDSVYALIASFLGWTLDAFDFFLVVFVMPAIAAEFHKEIPLR